MRDFRTELEVITLRRIASAASLVPFVLSEEATMDFLALWLLLSFCQWETLAGAEEEGSS